MEEIQKIIASTTEDLLSTIADGFKSNGEFRVLMILKNELSKSKLLGRHTLGILQNVEIQFSGEKKFKEIEEDLGVAVKIYVNFLESYFRKFFDTFGLSGKGILYDLIQGLPLIISDSPSKGVGFLYNDEAFDFVYGFEIESRFVLYSFLLETSLPKKYADYLIGKMTFFIKKDLYDKYKEQIDSLLLYTSKAIEALYIDLEQSFDKELFIKFANKDFSVFLG